MDMSKSHKSYFLFFSRLSGKNSNDDVAIGRNREVMIGTPGL